MVKTGMITNRWIDRRRPSWDRLSALLGTANGRRLKGLSADELREMAFLYRQIASDLSALQQDGTAPTLTAYVNQLLARSHNFVYSGRRTSATAAVRFLWVEYPRLIRRLHGFVHASLLLFLAGAVLGSLLTLARPEFMRHMLGPQMVATIEGHKMWTDSVASMAPQASSAIMTNNLSVTFTTFASGILAGLGTIYLIGWNGLLLGVVGTACAQAHMSASLWSFVAAHGSLELPAIVLSGAAGLRLSQGLLFPGPYSRRYALTETGRDAVKVMAGVIPMLVVAGILEGFLSPSGAPKALKFAVGCLLFTLLIVWLRMEHLEPARREPAQSAG
jgi:uncharacterized membrane protein SpoIIM required for sporulation